MARPQPVSAGQLDQRIKFQKSQPIDLPGGGTKPNYVDHAEVWASVQAITGTEVAAGGQVEASVRYRIWIYNRRDIDPSMRLVWVTGGGQRLNIRAMPDPGARAIFRELTATEGVAS